MKTRDKVYARRISHMPDFEFNNNVADKFDDMIRRSVPFYNQIQDMIASLSVHFVQNGTSVYDLGCSTGTTMVNLIKKNVSKHVKYIGVDLSMPMLKKCKSKLTEKKLVHKCELVQADISGEIEIENASLVLLNWTLQFVRPLHRDKLIKKIYDGLVNNGCLLVVEKVLGQYSLLNRLYIDLYYEYKTKMGYSKLEISQKREALENVLIPYRIEENLELLKKNNFDIIDIFFCWYNFAGFIAIKKVNKKERIADAIGESSA